MHGREGGSRMDERMSRFGWMSGRITEEEHNPPHHSLLVRRQCRGWSPPHRPTDSPAAHGHRPALSRTPEQPQVTVIPAGDGLQRGRRHSKGSLLQEARLDPGPGAAQLSQGLSSPAPTRAWTSPAFSKALLRATPPPCLLVSLSLFGYLSVRDGSLWTVGGSFLPCFLPHPGRVSAPHPAQTPGQGPLPLRSASPGRGPWLRCRLLQ